MGSAGYALLVEDDPDVGALLRHHLDGLHYDVWHVTTAEQALEHIAERSPDVAVIDILLPGVDGRTVVRELRSSPEHRACRIVVATIVDRDEIDVDVDAVLCKPFRRRDVVRAVQGGPGGRSA